MNNSAYDVIVVGAGPAGLAAAACAAEGRLRVLLVDDNPAIGGQIWRGEERRPTISEATQWRERVRAARVEVLTGARVFDAAAPGVLLAESGSGLHALRYWRLILATGARERFLPFPGWTLPNVMGAGGLQAMVKSGLPIERKRVVVAGSGPLLLAVAAYLQSHGAEVCAIAEQASRASLLRFAVAVATMPAKVVQGIQLKRQLSGVPYLAGCWPVAARGSESLQAVTLSRGDKTWEIACDYLACGFHLVPNLELPALLGCEVGSGFVAVDDLQRTLVPDIYCAGEPTGIGGLELSLIEGQIAGFAAAGMAEDARRLFGARQRFRKFARAMERAFALRPELRTVSDDTLLCRCEDVPMGHARAHRSWRAAKLHTRCGMGPCQGRVCGSAASFLFGWQTESVRPPVFPAQVAHLAAPAAAQSPRIEERL